MNNACQEVACNSWTVLTPHIMAQFVSSFYGSCEPIDAHDLLNTCTCLTCLCGRKQGRVPTCHMLYCNIFIAWSSTAIYSWIRHVRCLKNLLICLWAFQGFHLQRLHTLVHWWRNMSPIVCLLAYVKFSDLRWLITCHGGSIGSNGWTRVSLTPYRGNSVLPRACLLLFYAA